MNKHTSLYLPAATLEQLDRIAKSRSQSSFNTRSAVINLAVEALLAWRRDNPRAPIASFLTLRSSQSAPAFNSNPSKNV